MSNRLLAGTRKGLFVFDMDGRHATLSATHFLGEPATAVLPVSDTEWYVSLGHGHFGAKLHYTDDAGASFREIASPAYPPKPEGLEDLDPMRKQPIPWAVQQNWILEAGGAAGELWCGTIPGGLFRSADRGASWQFMDALWNQPARAKWFGGDSFHLLTEGLPDAPAYHLVYRHGLDVDGAGDTLAMGSTTGSLWLGRDGGERWSRVSAELPPINTVRFCR